MAIINVSEHIVRPNETFFFDANIWIYLYAPLSEFDKDKQEKYSSLLEKIMTRQAQIVINNMIVSEIANVIIRDRFKKYKQEKSIEIKFKEFWETDECKKAVKEIKSIIYLILELPNIQQISDNFNSLNLKDEIDDYYGVLDFNDTSIVNLCKKNNYNLVSADRDFDNISDFSFIS